MTCASSPSSPCVHSQFQEINPDDPTHEQYASQLVMALIAELENKATSLPGTDELFVVKLKLTDCANMFKVRGWGKTGRCAVGGTTRGGGG